MNMNPGPLRSMLISLSLATGLCLPAFAPPAFAQGSGDIPRTSSGKPDFNGVWEFPYVPDMSTSNGRNQFGPGELPYTAAGKLNFDRYDSADGDYTGAC